MCIYVCAYACVCVSTCISVCVCVCVCVKETEKTIHFTFCPVPSECSLGSLHHRLQKAQPARPQPTLNPHPSLLPLLTDRAVHLKTTGALDQRNPLLKPTRGWGGGLRSGSWCHVWLKELTGKSPISLPYFYYFTFFF